MLGDRDQGLAALMRSGLESIAYAKLGVFKAQNVPVRGGASSCLSSVTIGRTTARARSRGYDVVRSVKHEMWFH